MNRLQGKVAIVTGAASGLGAADARRMAAEGATVVLTDVNVELGEKTAAQIPGAVFMRQDVASEADWIEVVTATEKRFGRLDVLVNNAGLVKFGTVEETSLELFRLHQSVMAEGTFLGCKHAIPAMARSGGGSIINVSSVAAIKGNSPVLAYTAAKGAVLAMTRSIALHCHEKGYRIRCNCILPGAHETPMTAAAIAEVAGTAGIDEIMQHGQGQPEDVGNLVLFLASDEARHINGASIAIDNGETSR